MVRTADRIREPALFWAVRGGGGNFGVITRFTFALHQVGPTVTGGLIAWGGERASGMLAAYRALAESAPRELTAAAFVSLAPVIPRSQPSSTAGRWSEYSCATAAMLAATSTRLAGSADPSSSWSASGPYVEQQAMFDADLPAGLAYHERSEFLPGLSGKFLDAFHHHALQVSSASGSRCCYTLPVRSTSTLRMTEPWAIATPGT